MSENLKTEDNKKTTVIRLLGRAVLWALVLGAGITVFLYALAHFFGQTERSYLIALYWGPVTTAILFVGILFFQVPRAMKLPKGQFSIYLLFLSLPIFGLGALILWYFLGPL